MPNLKNTGSTSFRLPARAIAPATLGALLLLGVTADAGDILRGGAPMSQTRRNATAGSNAGADLASQTQNNATDRLARTTQALNAMKNFQAAARQAAQSAHARIADPNHPGKLLPFVPNGLVAGGLQVATGVPKNLSHIKPGEHPGLWTGADLPTQSKSGDGSVDVTIVQTKQQALLNWKTFNVGKKTTLTFDQSAGGHNITDWIAFNKINDPSGRPSQILGSIHAGGQVYVINQNGVIFGGSSQVNTHTLVASALHINQDLIDSGLVNNPKAEFLFNSLQTDNLLGKISDTTPAARLSEMVDPNSNPIVTAVITIKGVETTKTLEAGTDFQISTVDGKSTITFTDAGLSAMGMTKTSSPTALTVSYSLSHGNVVVEKGSNLFSPASADHVGGRIMLVGANVQNAGTISTPDGQTILAAGLQVGIDTHSSTDSSIRGLDTYVGSIADQSSKKKAQAGTAENIGYIDAPSANVTLTGKYVRQNGVIDSSTTVSLNGSVTLNASYDAVSNPAYTPSDISNGSIFNYQSTGEVTLGKGSVIRILPEISDTKTITGPLQLASKIDIRGHYVHFSNQSSILAPNASISVNSGLWYYLSTGSASKPVSSFNYVGGQIYAGAGSLIDVSGTTNVNVSQSENVISVQLRGSEVANSPLQRNSIFRPAGGVNPYITVDLRNTSTFNGQNWVGTPLANLTGYLNLIERTVAELTTAGGSVSFNSGGSVILQKKSIVDVSGGWIRYGGGTVQTTRLLEGNQIVDIANATPDQIYTGFYNPKFTTTHSKWGISQTFKNPLSLSGAHYESAYIEGKAGGSIAIQAPSMALDGTLTGNTVVGPKQLRNSSGTTTLPTASSLSLTFKSQVQSSLGDSPGSQLHFPYVEHTPPRIVFSSTDTLPAPLSFQINQKGNPVSLDGEHLRNLTLSPDLLGSDGFGSLSIDNSDGRIIVPADVSLTTQPDGSISFKAASIDIAGQISAPGGALDFTTYDYSPYQAAIDSATANTKKIFQTLPAIDLTRGQFTLRPSGSLSTAGLLVDDRFSASSPDITPIATAGGSISINSFSANLVAGSTIDVSGGVSMSSKSSVTYGNAGSITVKAGQDPNLAALLGGTLHLDSTLKGYSGASGGSLSIQAPLIRIAEGIAVDPSGASLHLTPNFFNQGGFSTFSFTGLGIHPTLPDTFLTGTTVAAETALSNVGPDAFLPGVTIAPGTHISPVVQSFQLGAVQKTGGTLALEPVLLPEGLRSPMSLSFNTPDLLNLKGELLVRGDLLVDSGTLIDAGPSGSVSLGGDTVSVLGSIVAPGGSISVAGAGTYPTANGRSLFQARPTVYLGPQSLLSAAGSVLLKPDKYNRRVGSVLNGGSISVSGNIVASAGSVLDVSGTSGVLDLTPGTAGLLANTAANNIVPVTSGLNSPLYSTESVPSRVDSNGGSITLKGSKELFVDSTLLGAAGGPTAAGGSLSVSSGRFYSTTIPAPTDVNLVVAQSGSWIPDSYKLAHATPIGHALVDATGKLIPAMGYFAVDHFLSGGFDSLTLDGNSRGVVRFVGPVTIDARQKISVAAGGVLYANDTVRLTAPYVKLGMDFAGPMQTVDSSYANPFVSTYGASRLPVYPTYGTGSLIVRASLIDIGDLALRDIGMTKLIADGGDIRGDGSFDVSGALYMRAGQIYPVTDTRFIISTYDYHVTDSKGATISKPGTIVVAASGSRDLPLSAGGELDLYASRIDQGGVLRAPLGTISLGWDGTGTPPTDRITGGQIPITNKLVLLDGSQTSVSGVNPVTGQELLVPFGLIENGVSWIDPSGLDITTGGVPAKSITLSANRLAFGAGATVDIRGGGNLLAYRWVEGIGGTNDILASTSSYAIIPGYDSAFAPYGAYSQTSNASHLGGDPGYVNSNLHVGDQVYLGASSGLLAGTYTLLPARYAVLPGALLVTPLNKAPTDTMIAMPDGSSIVSGYMFNGLDSRRERPNVYTTFEVAPSAVVTARAEYDLFYGNGFLYKGARSNGVTVPRLPRDAGHLVFASEAAMHLAGTVLSQVADHGIGAFIDISAPGDIVITGSGEPQAKHVKLSNDTSTIRLNAAELSSFGAESLLIGGIRSNDSGSTSVDVTASNITVRNAGTPLSGPEIILAANDTISMKNHSRIEQSGSMVAPAENLLIDGDGALLRVSGDPNASISRTDTTGPTTARLSIGRGATLAGTSLIVDSSSATYLDPRAQLVGDYVSLDSGQISLRLKNPGDLQPTTGLVLAGQTLAGLQGVKSLSLLSYSSIDIYGSGSLNVDGSLALHAAEIRGFNNGGNTDTFTAQTLLIDNSANGSRPVANGTPSGTLALDAGTITLGHRRVDVDQFANLNLTARNALVLDNKGRLVTEGSAIVTTPTVVATQSAVQGIVAGGDLLFQAPKNSTTSSLTSGLGASFTLQGSNVAIGSDILLPSGLLTVHATNGNVSIGGRLDVSGTQQTIYDLVKYTDGGQISLTADNGSVNIANGAALSVAANANGGNAGNLILKAPNGNVSIQGTLDGQGNKTGKSGSFTLDTGTIGNFANLNTALNSAGFNESRTIHDRLDSEIVLGGTVTSHVFNLSADAGSITVSGTIDASGATGGAINLIAAGSVTLLDGSTLTVKGADFNNAGKGGSISLEAGSEINGVYNNSGVAGSDGRFADSTPVVDIQSGSIIDLSVASNTDSSQWLGKFTGTLHLRAPQIASSTDLQVDPIEGTIRNASSIVVEGYKLYNLSNASGSTITSSVQNQVRINGNTFLGTAGTTTSNYTAMLDRLTGGNTSLDTSVLSIRPGAEIITTKGDLTLGKTTDTGVGDWNLQSYRFGPQSAPGILTLRAAGNLVFNSALQDGFDINQVGSTSSYKAPLLSPNLALPLNAQSWSYRLTAGSDLSAADFHSVLSLTNLGSSSGSLKLGKNTNATVSGGTSSGGKTSTALANGKFYQVIRTGSGDIDISAGRDVQLLNQFATIYTAGTLISDPTMGGTFDVPILKTASVFNSAIGLIAQSDLYAPQYTIGGGNVSISAQNDIAHKTLNNSTGKLVADSERQIPTNWLYRRGYVDPKTGQFGGAMLGDVASTTWWIDFSNFFEGIGALGGGNVTLTAGHDVSNIDAVAPTNARMPKGTPSASKLIELGGGDVTVTAGHDIDAGIYYVERGQGTLFAGDSIVTNSTRSPTQINAAIGDSRTWLPTTLFLGKGSFDIGARGDLLLGPVANLFLLPSGYLNGFAYKTYFSSYASTDAVNVSSIGGDVTLRESSTESAATRSLTPLLQQWLNNVLLYSPSNPSNLQPWLRLDETNVEAFKTVSTLMPGTLRAVAFSGDINLVGALTLTPSPTGTLDLAAGGSINGLQSQGIVNENSIANNVWSSSRIDLSDANPDSIPGVASPWAYQIQAGATNNAKKSGLSTMLDFINNLFAVTGSTDAVSQTKQNLHDSGLLHSKDTQPVHLYAASGDISGLTLFSPKVTRVIAGNDIADISLYIQNLSEKDVSVVSAGRDIIPYDANSPLRTEATLAGNVPGANEAALAGDIQIGGPGSLEVLAGRNLDLGTGSENSDGTGAGITSIGNLSNPYLPFSGASIYAGAGIGPSAGLSASNLDFKTFASTAFGSAGSSPYLAELTDIITPSLDSGASSTNSTLTTADLQKLSPEQQDQIMLDVLFLALRDAGRTFNNPASPDYKKQSAYTPGNNAIAALFGKHKSRGDIKTESRDIRTKNGGDIAIFAPGGSLTLANSTLGSTSTPPGIITEYGGNISVFTDGNVDLGIGRIFTLRGGNEILWSSNGNIAAGAASKTVASAPPVSVQVDPQSADVKANLAGLSTGGGIGVLATVEGVPPGAVDLIAPNGYVDAGDAGIRASGNLNIATPKILNASNITTGGTSTGVPSAPVSAAPNISGLSSGASATGATSNAANNLANQARQQQSTNTQDQNPSIYEVDVLGYGGGDSGDSSGSAPSSGGDSSSSAPEGAVSAERQSTAASLSTAPSPAPAAIH
jgi:filamentous hemagglutinin family protein